MRIRHLFVAVVALTLQDGGLLGEDQTKLLPLGQPLMHPAEIHGIAISSDGKWVATGCTDKKLRVWEVLTGQLKGEPRDCEGAVYPVAFSPDSKWVAGGTEKGARLWEVETGKELAEFPHRGFVYSLAFRPDGGAILTASHDSPTDGTAQLWRLPGGEPIGEPSWQRFYAVAFSPNSKWAAVSGNGNVVQLIDAQTGKPTGVELKHEGSVRSLSFSPDSTKLLTGSLDKTGRIWHVAIARTATPPLVHDDQVRAAAYSPLGTSVVTGSTDKTARLWDATTGRLLATMEHPSGVRCLAFSHDGRFVATGCFEGTAHVWDAATGNAVGQPIKHGGLVRAVAFGPGNVLLTGSFDKTARLFRIEEK
jgi:WD40 repeat protein